MSLSPEMRKSCMKEKRRTWIPVLVILAALLLFSAQAGTAEGEETAERTVMFYLCGSDLESNYEYATVNLEEILSCGGYGTMNGMMFQSTLDEEKTQETTVPEVRVVLETGGCRTWHARRVGMEIAADKLQR